MRRNHFEDNLLYVVDGELLNHMVRILRKFKEIRPEHKQVLDYMRKSIIQCSNHPTGGATDQWDEIELENWLFGMGIRLPNPEDPNNPYPEEDDIEE